MSYAQTRRPPARAIFAPQCTWNSYDCHASLARRMKAAGDAPFVSECAMILVQAVSSCKFAEARTNQRRFRLRRSKIFHVRSGVTLPLGCLTDAGF